MMTHTHTHTVNSLDEIISKAKEYVSKKEKWDLKRIYYKNSLSKKDKIGIVLKNDKEQTVKICFRDYEFKKEAHEKFNKDILKLFSIQFSEPNNQEKQEITSNDYSVNNKIDNSSIIWIIAVILLVSIGIGIIYWNFKKKGN